MIIRRALAQDAAELAEFNINMARETESIELIPEVIGAGVRTMIENPQMGFYLVVELDNGIQASLMITTEWSDWRNGIFWWVQSVYVHPDSRRQGVYRGLYQCYLRTDLFVLGRLKNFAAGHPGYTHEYD